MGFFDTVKTLGSGLWQGFKQGAKSIYDAGKSTIKGAKELLDGDIGKTLNQVLDVASKYGYNTTALKSGLRQARDITKKADTIVDEMGESIPSLFGDPAL